jgi:hypothetical protein
MTLVAPQIRVLFHHAVSADFSSWLVSDTRIRLPANLRGGSRASELLTAREKNKSA